MATRVQPLRRPAPKAPVVIPLRRPGQGVPIARPTGATGHADPGGHMGIRSGPYGHGPAVTDPISPSPGAQPKPTGAITSVSLNHTHLYNAAGKIIGTGGSGTYSVGKPLTIKGKSFYKITRSGKTYYVPTTAKSAVFNTGARSAPVTGGGSTTVGGGGGGLSDPGGAIAGGSGAGYGNNVGSGDLLGRLAGVSWISAAEIVVLLVVAYYAWTKVIGPRVGRKLKGKGK